MAIEHVDIADGERHEPKGISTAVAKSVYIANGSGTGTWAKITDPTNLTENSGAIGGTNDGNYPNLTTISATYVQAEVVALRDSVRELAAKINTLMANMRTTGIL